MTDTAITVVKEIPTALVNAVSGPNGKTIIICVSVVTLAGIGCATYLSMHDRPVKVTTPLGTFDTTVKQGS